MFKLSKKTKHTYTRNVSNIFKVSNKDTRTTPVTSTVNFEHILLFILLLLLLNSVWEDIVSNNKFAFSKCEKYVVLWAGKVCLATRFHLYSPKTRLRKDNFSRQLLRNISRTLFWFSGSKLGPKMNQNCKLWVHSIWAKIHNFEGFFKHCVCLIGRIPLAKISARSNNIWGSKAQNPPKKDHFIDAESIRKSLKICNFTTQMLYWWNLPDIYLNKVFHLAKFKTQELQMWYQGRIQAQFDSGWPLWAPKKIRPKMFFVAKINMSFSC